MSLVISITRPPPPPPRPPPPPPPPPPPLPLPLPLPLPVTSVVVSRQDEPVGDEHDGRVQHAQCAVLPHVQFVRPEIPPRHLVRQLGYSQGWR